MPLPAWTSSSVRMPRVLTKTSHAIPPRRDGLGPPSSQLDDTWLVVEHFPGPPPGAEPQSSMSLCGEHAPTPVGRPLPKVVMQFCSSGLLVQDDTDTLRRLLETLGGRRDAALNGWLFPFGSKYKIVIALRVGGYRDHTLPEVRHGLGPRFDKVWA